MTVTGHCTLNSVFGLQMSIVAWLNFGDNCEKRNKDGLMLSVENVSGII